MLDCADKLLVAKIDVEGHEEPAIEGLLAVLAKNHCVLQIEIWDLPNDPRRAHRITEQLARREKGRDITLLAVSVDDSWDAVRQFFVKGTKMGVLLDLSKNVPRSFGTEKYPESFMIDSSGHVRHYFINKRDWSRPEAVACMESLR